MIDDKVLEFRLRDLPSEETARRAKTEAERLAGLAEVDWLFQLEASADRIGVKPPKLRAMVTAILKDRAKKTQQEKAEDRHREERAEKQRKDQQHEERERRREQDRADKETQRKRREKEREFAQLAKLPRSEQEARLGELAKRLDEDPAVLRDEFEAFSGGGLGDRYTPATPAIWNVEPWDEPVDVAVLLQKLVDQIRKYVVLVPERLLATALWTTTAWIHNEVATRSPILDVFSIDEGSGKTELLGVLALLVPKPLLGAEFTGPNVYRVVDADKPTLLIDEADDIFQRKPDLKHIVNGSWTRGFKIPRQVRMKGEWQTYWFDPFCPKVLGHTLLPGKPLPRTTASRGVPIKVWPKRRDEKTEEFKHRDDEEFLTLRRKLLRFANDHASAIEAIKPKFPAGFGPAGFNNRRAANWKLLLAIAELAGGEWPDRARKAAEYIAGKGDVNQGTRLFAAFHAMCVEKLKQGATEIALTSAEAVEFLKAFDTFWATEYRGSDNHPGEITQHKLGALLRLYELGPQPVHPTKRETLTRGGYKIRDTKGKWNAVWLDMFARYCPGLPNIQTLSKRK
jgi:hypothetical protein